MKDFSPLAIAAAAIGFPARLGVITRLDGTVIRFAESDEAITVGGDTFAVVPGLQVSAVKHTANGELPSCQITAVHAPSAIFDARDFDAGLFDGALVQIYIVDRNNLTRKGLLFSGVISTIAYNQAEHQVVIDVSGPSTAAKIALVRKRSPMCGTDLFSVLCGLNKTSYAVSTSVAVAGDNFTFTVTGSLAQATGYFDQGVGVTADGVAFEIAGWNQSTQTITTYLPCNRILTNGLGLTLYPGCDKTLTATGCAKFSNQLNFVGEPHFLGVAAAAQQI